MATALDETPGCSPGKLVIGPQIVRSQQRQLRTNSEGGTRFMSTNEYQSQFEEVRKIRLSLQNKVVRMAGIEPASPKARDFKSLAFTSFATSAGCRAIQAGTFWNS